MQIKYRVFANDFAVDVVAEFAVDENFIIDANAVLGAEQHNLRVGKMVGGVFGLAREENLRTDKIIINEPMNNVNFVNGGIVDSHARGVAVGGRRDCGACNGR